MPPRSRPAIVEVFHGSFDPGFTGRRTGINQALPSRTTATSAKVRINNNGLNENELERIVQQNTMKLVYLDGVSPPLNVSWDENGVEDFKAYVSKANEQTANWVAIQRKKLQTQSQTLFHAIEHDENASELEVGHHHHSSPPESLQDKELDHEKAKDVTNVYGRGEVVDVIRIPKEPTLSFSIAQPKRSVSKAKSKKATLQPRPVDPNTPPHPEAGCDSKTLPNAVVQVYMEKREEQQMVVCTHAMMESIIDNSATDLGAFQVQTLFGEPDFVSSGVLAISCGESKPLESSEDNSLMFVVVASTVSAMIHKTTYVIGNGGMFMIPRGNDYSITNIGKERAKLTFFTLNLKKR
ncbi:hypothetical protein Pst134EB_030933 [Puccinia striiformis f. sp. tritici]|nr:hypothetical protein Pst134EB_030933 [Puccinia striiformis f. sp. tritici]